MAQATFKAVAVDVLARQYHEARDILEWLVDLQTDGPNPRQHPRWSPAEIDYLHNHYRTDTHSEMGIALGRSASSVRNRCSMLGLRKAAAGWSAQEVSVLRDWYSSHTTKDQDLDTLAIQLGRLKSNVCRKARALGLTDQHRPLTPAMRQARGDYQRQWLAAHGHPRGALGMKHSPETREQLSLAAQRLWAGMTPEKLEVSRVKRNATNIERYGTGAPGLTSANAYSRAKRGRRADLDNRYFRSSWEANYARYLTFLRDNGEIVGWEYEPETFIFHGVTRNPLSYLPDFKVIENDGSVVYHEVKGWMDPKSKSKLRRMAKFYPAVKIVVVDEDAYKALAKWASLIEGWE